MREIKFRCWDKKRKIMLYPKFGDISNLSWHGHDGKSETDRHIFQQFTGLRDANRKEIYEGDIIAVRTLQDGDEYCWDNEKQKPVPQLVKWNKQECRFDFGYASRIRSCPHHFEVIGNIYEDSELLKKGD